MNEFMTLLNAQLFDQERIFKYKGAELTGNTVKIDLLVSRDDYLHRLDDELRDKVQNIAKSLLPEHFSVSIDYIKAVNDGNTLIRLLLEYIQKERPNFYSLFAAVPIETEFNNDLLTVTFTLEKFLHEYAVESNLEKELKEYLDTVVLEETDIVYIETPNSEGKEIKQTEFIADPIRVIQVKPTKYFTSHRDFAAPRYIYDVKDSEADSVTVCGVISGIKSKYVEKILKTIYTFNIYDTTATFTVKYFAKPNKNFDWADVFVDGAVLMVKGAIKYDNFVNGLVMTANYVASCEIDYSDINVKSNYNKEYSDYRYIFPEPVHDEVQESFFDDNTVPENMKGKTFCVFDLETTGLNTEQDEIIEIASIKIVDGIFKEQFTTFVRPSKDIPPEVVEITHIRDEDVALAPLPKDVIPDFYRFTRGAILVGHNIIGFDVPLLNSNAARCKYEFTNEAMDTLMMAKSVWHDKKNRLCDICERLNVPLVDAHRAINDVTANAKAFIKLMKMEK